MPACHVHSLTSVGISYNIPNLSFTQPDARTLSNIHTLGVTLYADGLHETRHGIVTFVDSMLIDRQANEMTRLICTGKNLKRNIVKIKLHSNSLLITAYRYLRK